MKLPLTHVWQPARTPSQQLIVVLHGQGGSAEEFRPLQDELGTDELDYLLLDAPDPLPFYGGYRWYNWDGDPLADITRSRGLLTEVFTATGQAGYAPERTFLLGFSQGCLMTLEFGSRHTRRLAGYIGISGYVLDPAAILRDLNQQVNSGDWLVTHGTSDEMVKIEKTRAQIHTLQEGGFHIDYREYEKAHSLDEHRELPEIRAWIGARVNANPFK